MDTLREARHLLAGLFPDGGRALLADGGLGEDWPQALAHVPPRVLGVAPGPDAGLRQLLALRDFWNAQGDLRPALAATRALLGLRVAALGRDHPDALVELAALGTLVERAGRADEGRAMLEQAWAGLGPLAGARDLRVAVVAQNVAGARARAGMPADALAALEIAYGIRKALAPATTGLVAAQLGEVRMQLGRTREALPLLEEAHKAAVEREGEVSPRAGARAQTLGAAYNRLERWTQAARVLEPVHASLPEDADPDRRATLAFELGLALVRSGSREAGLRRLEESLRVTRELRAPDGGPHRSLPNRLTLLAELQLEKGRVEEAEGLLQEALEAEKRAFGPASPQVGSRYLVLGRLAVRRGRSDEALGWLDAAASLLRSTLGDAHPDTAAAVEGLVARLLEEAEGALSRRDRDLARELLRRAHAVAAPVLGHAHEKVRKVRDLLDRGLS